MEIFFSIVSIIGIIIVGFTLFLCIRKDYKMKKLYNSAEKCKALVLKEIGTESLSEYGAGVIGGVILSAICIILKINNIW